MGHEVGLQASAGRGFSPPTCIVLYCIASAWLTLSKHLRVLLQLGSTETASLGPHSEQAAGAPDAAQRHHLSILPAAARCMHEHEKMSNHTHIPKEMCQRYSPIDGYDSCCDPTCSVQGIV